MRLLVVRHYRTINNQARVIMGWGDAPPAAGWEKDLLWVKERLLARGIVLDGIWSSALGRAKETARYYGEALGCSRRFASSQLNEVNYGILRQRPKSWVESHVPQYKTDPAYVFPEGESFDQMQVRVVAFVEQLQADNPQATLLLVVHAGVIRGLVCHCLGLGLRGNLKRKISHRYIGEFLLTTDGHCCRYEEWGKPSGFAKSGLIQLPWQPRTRRTATGQDPTAVSATGLLSLA